MKKSFLVLLAAVSIFAAGCVHLPSPTSIAKATPAHVTLPSTVSPGIPLHIEKGTVKSSPTKNAIQTAVNWQATLCVIGGLAALGFGAFLIYTGHILAGVKMVAVGVLLPIFGIWFAYHWLLVIILTLVGFAAYWLCLNYGVVQPVLAKIEAAAKTDVAKVTSYAATHLEHTAPTTKLTGPGAVPPAVTESKA